MSRDLEIPLATILLYVLPEGPHASPRERGDVASMAWSLLAYLDDHADDARRLVADRDLAVAHPRAWEAFRGSVLRELGRRLEVERAALEIWFHTIGLPRLARELEAN